MLPCLTGNDTANSGLFNPKLRPYFANSFSGGIQRPDLLDLLFGQFRIVDFFSLHLPTSVTLVLDVLLNRSYAQVGESDTRRPIARVPHDLFPWVLSRLNEV